jgi:rhodanese-related sulfurtransferase
VPPLAPAETALTVIDTETLARRAAADPATWDFTLVDARSRVEFEASHIAGAVNLPARLVKDHLGDVARDKNRTVVFYCNGPTCTKSQKAARAAIALGYTKVLVDNDGLPAWEQARHGVDGKPLPVVEIPAIPPPTLAAVLARPGGGGRALHPVDVRDEDEFAAFHLDGAVNIPLDDLARRAAEIPEGPVCLVDHAGHQNVAAGRVLATLGRHEVGRLDGGMLAWQRAGLPLVTKGTRP